MLAHMTQTSEGAGVAGVKITDRSVANSRDTGTCHSGIKLGSDGVLYKLQSNGGFSSVSGEWLVTGTASNFYAQHTIISGTLEVGPASGWNQLSVDLTYDNQKSSNGTKETEVFFEISSDVSGTPVVGSATMFFISIQGEPL